MTGRIIAVVNNKGGVGKTSLSVNLGAALAEAGSRTLILDLDPQCDATSLLLPHVSPSATLYEVLDGQVDDPGQCVVDTGRANLHCLPNAEESSALEADLSKNLPDNYGLLRNRLRDFCRRTYAYTIMDCPPNLGFFVISALFCADCAVVPVLSGSAFSIKGLAKALNLIEGVRENGNPGLVFLRLLVNNVDRRVAMSKVTTERLYSHFSQDQIFRVAIPADTRFQQAEQASQSIFDHAPRSRGAKAYRKLAAELAGIVTAAEAA